MSWNFIRPLSPPQKRVLQHVSGHQVSRRTEPAGVKVEGISYTSRLVFCSFVKLSYLYWTNGNPSSPGPSPRTSWGAPVSWVSKSCCSGLACCNNCQLHSSKHVCQLEAEFAPCFDKPPRAKDTAHQASKDAAWMQMTCQDCIKGQENLWSCS